MSEHQQNLKRFKIITSTQYIQIIPLLTHFQTQILINKQTHDIRFENIDNHYTFSDEYNIRYASLILGLVQIQKQNFLLYAQNVYLQASFPPHHSGVYQIASINFLEYNPIVSNRQREIFNTLKTEIFNFSFYFSFDRDLTLSCQKYYTDDKRKSRQAYFWNYDMIRAMMKGPVYEEWFIPLIQGHYGGFELAMGHHLLGYYLISRRSKYRSGTRFYNRGIDENSKCSQFIETEQIMVLGNEISSFVSLSGSVPLFWEQKSQTDKIRLTRNKELTTLPFLEHLTNIRDEFSLILIVNLLQQKKESENLLLQAYEQLVAENSLSLHSFLRYIYLDMNQLLKCKAYQQIFNMIHNIEPFLKEFGLFRYDALRKEVHQQQTGVFRINCLDCLSRTNKFMQVLFYHTLADQLYREKILSQSVANATLKELLFAQDNLLSALLLNFRTLWQQKADFQSMIYAGSRATNGKKNKFLDDLQDSFISLQRLYNQKFIDEIKQKSLDIVLYHKYYRRDSMLRNKQSTELQICIASWNVNATNPDSMAQLDRMVAACEGADLVVFGLQEMIELSTNNVVSNNEEQSAVSVKWGKRLQKLLNSKPDKKIFVQKVEMVGLMLVMFVSDAWKHAIKSVQRDTVRTGMGGQFGNKGAVVLRVKLFQTSFCFTCAHLSAGFSKTKERLDDFVQIHKKSFQQSKVGVQNEIEIERSDYKFFFGDLNFRINGDFKEIKDILLKSQAQPERRKQAINQLIEGDQLTLSRKDPNAPHPLPSYQQSEIQFLPTYKLDKATGQYTDEKSRNPSWCDRILYWANEEHYHECECLQYQACPITGSDHRPVTGRFRVVINQPMHLSPTLSPTKNTSPPR